MTNTTITKLSQYSAVRDGGAGWFDLSARGRILVSGSEAVTFLNGLITNDMKTLALNSWMTAAFANVQGRLLAVVHVLHQDDGFLIDTENVTHERVLNMLNRFTLAGDFRVADMSSEIAMLTVQGRKAADIIGTVINEDAGAIQPRQLLKTPFGQTEATIIRATHTAEDGFDVFIDANATQQLLDSLTAAGATAVEQAVAETLRIEAGIPLYGVDMDETTIVTETNLDDAVSFTKGCYLGQEIVVRIKHRGHVAKKLAGIVSEDGGVIKADAKIISDNGKEIGGVTSSTFSPRLDRTIALAYVKYDYLAPGTKAMVADGENKLTGSVTELPFVRGSWYRD